MVPAPLSSAPLSSVRVDESVAPDAHLKITSDAGSILLSNGESRKVCLLKSGFNPVILVIFSVLGVIGGILYFAYHFSAVKVQLGNEEIYIKIDSLKDQLGIGKTEVAGKDLAGAEFSALFKSKFNFLEETGVSELPSKIQAKFSEQLDKIRSQGVLLEDAEHFYTAHRNGIGVLKILRLPRRGDLVGKGGFSNIRKIYDLSEGVDKAFRTTNKTLPLAQMDALIKQEDAMRRRFSTKPGDASGVQTPHEVILDFPAKTIGGGRFFGGTRLHGTVEELYAGDLSAKNLKKFTLIQKLEVAIKGLEALQVMWKVGPHGDLKPGNICYFEEDGVIKIRIIDLPSEKDFKGYNCPRTSRFYGIQDFENLEQAYLFRKPQAYKDAVKKADVFAMGVILINILTGEFPHNRVVVDRRQGVHGRPDKAVLRKLPKPLRSLLKEMISSDPELRPENLDAVLKVFKDFMGQQMEIEEKGQT